MLRSIEKENIYLRSDITQLQQKLRSLQASAGAQIVTTPEVASDEPVTTDVAVIRQKCKEMRSIINNLHITALPNDHSTRYQLLCSDLKARIKQSQDCIDFLSAQKQELYEEYDKEKKVGEELKMVIDAARFKIQQTEHETFSQAEVTDRVKGKCATVDKMYKERLKQLNAFIDKHFPIPDEATFKTVKRKTHTLANRNDLLPLKTIIKRLMDACISNPNDPYIQTDETFWPMYVELLLACDIALVHPADLTRIKLMPFHL